MSEFINKLKEVSVAVLPITLIVIILQFTVNILESKMFFAFLIGCILIIIGLSIFLIGIDLGLEPIGHLVGNAITMSNSYKIAIFVSLILGFFISFAEPDLHILAKQVNIVTSGAFNNFLFVIAVSLGLAFLMTFGMLRILKNIPLKYVFTGSYLLILILSLLSNPDFISIAFDASGATTGAISVPFMLALSSGVASMKKDSTLNESDNFGIIGISSTGAIIGILVCGLFFKNKNLTGSVPQSLIIQSDLFNIYINKLNFIAKEAFLTLLPIILTYAILQIFIIKQKKKRALNIIIGIIFTYIGLVLFLLGVNGGFMAVGVKIGVFMSSLSSKVPLLALSLLLGISTVLAEPAVHVLTKQVEETTSGSIPKKIVLIFLSIAVGFSIFMALLKIIIPSLHLWMYLLVGFLISIILSYFIPDLFLGLALDAGGVASGPMCATFLLSFVQGVAHISPSANVVTDGFGMIAIVAMMPIISIEILGFLYHIKLKNRG